MRCDGRVDLGPIFRHAAPTMGNSRPYDAVSKLPACRHSKATILKPGAPAFLGPKAFIGQRLIDKAVGNLRPPIGTLLLHCDRNGKMRNPVKEVRRSIERIDQPTWLGRIAFYFADFFGQDAPVGSGVAKLLEYRLLGALVGHRNEIRRALAADLQLLDLAEVTTKARRRFVRGALHDGDEAGVGYQVIAF